MRQFIRSHRFSLIVFLSAAVIIAVIFLLFSADDSVNTQNIEYIQSFGWTVDPHPTEIAHLTIPQEFDVIYETYNAIEKDAGFDLSAYSGVRVTRYSYKVTNHVQSENGLIRANVFIHDGQIIAADLCSLDVGGFMIPLSDTADQLAQ